MSLARLAAGVAVAVLGGVAGSAWGIDQSIDLAWNFNGMVHAGESDLPDDPNGFRSISDRALLIDGAPGSFGTDPIVGATGMPYTIITTPGVLDIVHLGDRSVFWPFEFEAPGPVYNIGVQPDWHDASNPPSQLSATTDVTSQNITLFGNSQLGFLYQCSNGGGVAPAFDVTLTFTDFSSVTVTLRGPDWFGGTSILPARAAGVISQTRVGGTSATWPATNNNDAGLPAPVPGQNLSVMEGVISVQEMIADGLGDHTGKQITTITFHNAVFPGTLARGYAILAASHRGDPVYPPQATGSASPATVAEGATVKLIVDVVPGSAPGAVASLVVDAGAINGSAMQALNDSGLDGDLIAGDNRWSADVFVPLETPGAAYLLPFTLTDVQDRQVFGSINVQVIGRPLADDLGTLTPGVATVFNSTLEPGTVKWVTFTLAQPVSVTTRTFLDIDSEGSLLSGGQFPDDTLIGLYDTNGTLIASDDDDGSSFRSQLTFGSTTPRPAVDNGLAYNGRDGAMLPAGQYYLACAAFASNFGTSTWNVTSTSAHSGTITLNLLTDTAPVPTPTILVGPVTNPANGNDYYLFNIGLGFHDAEAAAAALGGHLASIADFDENEWVRANVLTFDGTSRRAWIGLTDEAEEGVFTWTDGSPLTFTNWSSGEPNNAGVAGEDYVEMFGSGTWNDVGPQGATGGAFALVEVEGTPACVADFNMSGGVTVQDIFDFLTAYFGGDPRADVNGVGGVSVQDIFDFLAAYFAGC